MQARGHRCPPFKAPGALDRVSNAPSSIVDRLEVAGGAGRGHTALMTIPMPVSRLTLVPAPPTPAPGGAVVRRYRLARLVLNGRPDPRDRHGHLKRVYD